MELIFFALLCTVLIVMLKMCNGKTLLSVDTQVHEVVYGTMKSDNNM